MTRTQMTHDLGSFYINANGRCYPRDPWLPVILNRSLAPAAAGGAAGSQGGAQGLVMWVSRADQRTSRF